MAATLEVGEDGSLTLPEEALRALRLAAPSQLEWKVEEGRIVLTPVGEATEDAVPGEDAWAYTPEHRQAVQRSRGQRGYRLGPADVEELIDAAEQARRAGREYRVSESDLRARETRYEGIGRA